MQTLVDAQSFVDTHEAAFVVIDKRYCIKALNKAFEESFHFDRRNLREKKCFEIMHFNDIPCHGEDEDCPYTHVFKLRKPSMCQHTHYDGQGQFQRVLVKGYPLKGLKGELLLGMSIQKFASQNVVAEDSRLIGQSPAFFSCMEQLSIAAQSASPVLLSGETGTGKELAARFIHHNSDRKDKPFVTIDCTVLSETLFESEVFGHERGSFTGSEGMKAGLIELADSGTLFLDEISEMPIAIQSKLLRVIETGEYRRVGGRKTLRADIRVISATNRDLPARVRERLFRKDLYYRIAVFSIHMPPLRERLSDIPSLSEELLNRLLRTSHRRYRITNDALQYLMSYEYPGNIRELRNLLELAATHSKNGLITCREIKHYAAFGPAAPGLKCGSGAPSKAVLSQGKYMYSVESQLIADLLKKFLGKRREVAKALGISERTLYRKMKRYRLK